MSSSYARISTSLSPGFIPLAITLGYPSDNLTEFDYKSFYEDVENKLDSGPFLAYLQSFRNTVSMLVLAAENSYHVGRIQLPELMDKIKLTDKSYLDSVEQDKLKTTATKSSVTGKQIVDIRKNIFDFRVSTAGFFEGISRDMLTFLTKYKPRLIEMYKLLLKEADINFTEKTFSQFEEIYNCFDYPQLMGFCEEHNLMKPENPNLIKLATSKYSYLYDPATISGYSGLLLLTMLDLHYTLSEFITTGGGSLDASTMKTIVKRTMPKKVLAVSMDEMQEEYDHLVSKNSEAEEKAKGIYNDLEKMSKSIDEMDMVISPLKIKSDEGRLNSGGGSPANG